jgi:hypothetical protein
MLKTISSITNALGALNYKGTWNALTNSPTLADGTGAKGDYYVTSTAGTQTFGGLLLFFGVGDWIVYNGAVWQRVEGGSDGNFANITLNSTDAGASAAPLLDLYRDSASPAASDTLGEIEFNGKDSAGNKQQYGLIHGSILSPTSGSEQGQLHFETATAGASTEKMIIGTTNLVVNEIGAVFNVRIEGDTDANLLYTDATNDRVGVGTASPSVKFEVNGAAKASSLSLTTPLPTASGGTNLSSFTSGGVVYASSTSALATGSVLNLTGTSLGINGASANLAIDSGGAGGIGNVFGVVGTTHGVVGTNTNTPLVINTNNTERMRIDTSGIVTMNAYGAGAATFSAAGVISSVSDETWKIKDGVPVDADSMLKKLEPGYWYYNDEKKEIFGADRQLGFYAQNVNFAIGPEAAPEPETITTTLENGTETETTKPWGYYDRSVLAVTVMSLQKALATIESLNARITELEKA